MIQFGNIQNYVSIFMAVKAETFKIYMQIYSVGYCFYKLEF